MNSSSEGHTKPLISLVIPVYNVEKCLPYCLQSVLAQTYENLEIILVDDGSTDQSGQICDEYGRDERVRVFHKANGGLSDARNFGVQMAQAALISFIDSDDYVVPSYVEYLYDLMEKYDADISYAEKKSAVDYNCKEQEETVIEKCLSVDEALEEFCLNATSACARLYKKDILLKHPFPIGKLYEDIATVYKLFDECERVAYSSRKIYYYVRREGSIQNSRIDEEHLYVLSAASEMFEFINKYHPAVAKAAKIRCASASLTLMSTTTLLQDERSHEYFKRAREFLMPYMRAVLTEKNKPLHFKLGCIAIALGYYPAKLILPIRQRIKIWIIDRST